MYAQQTTVINQTGLHARPASDFVTEAKKYASKITIRNLSDDSAVAVNAKSIVRILSEGMGPGTNVEISAEGEDETAAVDGLIALINSGFGE
jgi:phosphocarrier protein